VPVGVRGAEEGEGSFGKETGLIEAAFFFAGGEEGDRDDDNVSRRVGLQPGDGGGHAFGEQGAGEAVHAVELEEVEGFADLVVVSGEGDGAVEVGRSEAAHGALGGTEGGGEAERLVGEEFAAAGAGLIGGGVGTEGFGAGFADGDVREREQWATAEAAVRWKEGGDEVVGGTSKDARDGAPAGCRGLIRACRVAGRSCSVELDDLHAFAEDKPSRGPA